MKGLDEEEGWVPLLTYYLSLCKSSISLKEFLVFDSLTPC